MQPAEWYDAEKEDQDETAKRVAVEADELDYESSTSGSFKVSHFMNFSTKYSKRGTPSPIL